MDNRPFYPHTPYEAYQHLVRQLSTLEVEFSQAFGEHIASSAVIQELRNQAAAEPLNHLRDLYTRRAQKMDRELGDVYRERHEQALVKRNHQTRAINLSIGELLEEHAYEGNPQLAVAVMTIQHLLAKHGARVMAGIFGQEFNKYVVAHGNPPALDTPETTPTHV